MTSILTSGNSIRLQSPHVYKVSARFLCIKTYSSPSEEFTKEDQFSMKLSGFIAPFAVLSITNALSLQALCRTTFGRKRLGSQCNSYWPRCQVSAWSQWAQSPTKLEIDTSCQPSRSRGIQERKRTVTVFGLNCSSLIETRKANCNFGSSESCDFVKFTSLWQA